LTAAIRRGFLAREGQTMRAALYARVSTHEQQTLGLQAEAMTAYIKGRGWDLVRQVEDVGSGAKQRPGREGYSRPPAAARSTPWSSGAWTAGGGHCPTWW
jgi:hypothetical protein